MIRNIDPRLETIKEIRRQLTRVEIELMDYTPRMQATKCHLHAAAKQLQTLL